MAQNLLSQRKIIRKLHRVKEKGLLMQYHSIIIENLPKRMHNKYLTIAHYIRESFRAHFKIIISQKCKTQLGNHSDKSRIVRIYITFLEKHLLVKVYSRCTMRSKLPYLPLFCYFSETLLCCE